MAENHSISVYIGSKKTIKEKIKAIQLMIDALELRVLEVVNGQGAVTDEYWMNDGQMNVKTIYRSVSDVEAGVLSLEKLKQKYINRYNGRSTSLRDVRGLH